MSREAIEMQYLLGKLSEAEAARLEERSFTDDSVFEEIEIAEDDLIDAYVRGNLSAGDRKRFENKLLNSERLAERVEFAKVLSSPQVDHKPVTTHWWDGLFSLSFLQSPVLSGVAAAGLLLVVVGVPVFQWIRMSNERRFNAERAALEQQRQDLDQRLADQQTKTNQLDTELQKSKAEEKRLEQELQTTKEELARANEQSVAPAVATLYDISTRGPSPDVLNVPSSASVIRLRLVLNSDPFTSYQATIRSPAVPNVHTRERLKTRRSGQAWVIILEFPSRKLNSGVYSVSVSGRTPPGAYKSVADYSFRVSKK